MIKHGSSKGPPLPLALRAAPTWEHLQGRVARKADFNPYRKVACGKGKVQKRISKGGKKGGGGTDQRQTCACWPLTSSTIMPSLRPPLLRNFPSRRCTSGWSRGMVNSSSFFHSDCSGASSIRRRPPAMESHRDWGDKSKEGGGGVEWPCTPTAAVLALKAPCTEFRCCGI